ncbi:MAG: hypothetical protein HC866_04005 [Leptolyngbyaceae cyanobacterium RU_5_1]|nr:hypothetical protein [Leptolyngbyaceae cyanobacterium RU_5_1]
MQSAKLLVTKPELGNAILEAAASRSDSGRRSFTFNPNTACCNSFNVITNLARFQLDIGFPDNSTSLQFYLSYPNAAIALQHGMGKSAIALQQTQRSRFT